MRPRLDQNHFGIEDDAATPDAKLIDEGTDRAHPLATHDFAANDPVQRAAIDQLRRALGHHAGAMNVLGLLTVLALGLELFLDPALKLANGIAADAKLDQIHGHLFSLRRSLKRLESL